MELKQLERFLAVADNGTLAAAARTLGLTQQALSASLSGLEAELDVRLFDRAPGGITRLTQYGDALLGHARAQLAADARARADLASLRDARHGVVNVGIGETFAGDILADAVTQFTAERPGIRINLVESYSELILDRLYNGEFDFAAVGVGGVSLPSGFRADAIYAANDVVACRAGHPLAQRQRLTLADLVGYPWLVPYSRPSDTDAIVEAFVAEGLAPPDQFTGSDAYRVGMKILAKNDYLTMNTPALVTSVFAKSAFNVKVLPIDKPTVHRTASLVIDTERPLTPAAEALLNTVQEVARNFDVAAVHG